MGIREGKKKNLTRLHAHEFATSNHHQYHVQTNPWQLNTQKWKERGEETAAAKRERERERERERRYQRGFGTLLGGGSEDLETC